MLEGVPVGLLALSKFAKVKVAVLFPSATLSFVILKVTVAELFVIVAGEVSLVV